MATHAEQTAAALEREWWIRLPLVLHSPRYVFRGLRDDSDEAAAARAEPMLAIAFLAGISLYLSTTSAGQLYDTRADSIGDRTIVFSVTDPLTAAVLVVIAGALFAVQAYWLGGAALWGGVRSLEGELSYRASRHLVGLALMPLVLELLVVWPVRFAVFGEDVFKRGGRDAGLAGDVFHGIDFAILAWVGVLAVLGIREVTRWSWWRCGLAAGVTAVFVGLVSAAAVLL